MDHHEVLIVGGGNAGISLAARLLRDGAPDVAVATAESTHLYRPLLSYVGAGEARMSALERPMADVVPEGCTWLRDSVVSVDAEASTVLTAERRTVGYGALVLCPGLEEDWDSTPGLRAAYDAGQIASTFVAGTAPDVWPALRSLRSGSVVFTVPPEPAPCGATALKPLFMACDHWRRTGVLADLTVRLVLPGPEVLGVPRADRVLERTLADHGVEVLREARVESVAGAARTVTVTTPEGSRALTDLDVAHVVPHYRAPRWIAASGLADGSDAGLVDVDPRTLRHRRHASVWALGDAAAVATRPSGGALRKQVAVLATNLEAARRDAPLEEYDGYTVMPITTSRRRLMLVEVDREGRPAPSVPVVDLVRPRRTTWLVDRYGLPVTYFRRILRGKV